MHVHVTPKEISDNYEKYKESEPYFYMLSSSKQNKFATAEEIVEDMKRTGIDKSVIFGFGFRDMGLCRYVNDYVIEKTKDNDKLIGFISVNPNSPEAAYEIERCVSKGLKGIGELFPEGQQIDLVNKEATLDFTNAVRKFDIPMIIHMNEAVGHYYVGKTSTTLKEIEQFVLNNQDLKIILAHFGGGVFMYELMKEIREGFRNVYYDNAAAIFLYDPKIYSVMKEMGLMDKLVFGSDFPLLSPSRYEKSLKASGLTREDFEKMFVSNPQKILGDILK